MPEEGSRSRAGSGVERLAIVLAVIVGLVIVGAIAAALLAHPASSASAGAAEAPPRHPTPQAISAAERCAGGATGPA